MDNDTEVDSWHIDEDVNPEWVSPELVESASDIEERFGFFKGTLRWVDGMPRAGKE